MLTGRKVLYILIASFGVVVGVNVFFIVEAVSTFRGEDEHNPYLQGLDYNDTLKAHSEQAALGWQASIAASRNARGSADVVVALAGKDGKPLSNIRLEAELRHPSDAERDRVVALHAIDPGHYVANLPAIGSGAWDVIVRADGKTPFQASRRVWLR